MSRAQFLAVRMVACLVAATVGADDWPQWRGRGRDGRSADTGLLREWPPGGPPKLWSAAGFGTGFSSVAVAQGRIVTMGDLAGGQYVLAARESDGTLLWRSRVGRVLEHEYPGPRSTPTLVDDRVYALGTGGDLVCLDAATGREIWRKDILREFGGRQMRYAGQYYWHVSESPLVDGDRVIVTPGATKALLVAMNAVDGRELWRTRAEADLGAKGDDGAAYASAVISTAAGVRQYVQLVGRGAVGVEAATGRLLWSYNRVANGTANISTPLVNDNLVFVSTAYEAGAALLEVTPAQGGLGVTERYFMPAKTFQNHHGNMVLDSGVVYAGHGHSMGLPIAIELASGRVLWGPVRNAGLGSAAVAWAEGRLYFRYQNGRMLLIDASPGGYRERGSFEIPDVRRESWSHPVIANGKLLLREQDQLHAYDLRAGRAPVENGR